MNNNNNNFYKTTPPKKVVVTKSSSNSTGTSTNSTTNSFITNPYIITPKKTTRFNKVKNLMFYLQIQLKNQMDTTNTPSWEEKEGKSRR
jgi:hypothetical protein